MNGIGSSQPFSSVQDTIAPANTGRLSRTGVGLLNQAGTASLNGGAETSLSATAGTLAAALSGSDVRTDKVISLQQSLAAGSYSVDASAVADKLLGAMMN